MACDLGAKALFPFGGPPWHPFIAWAKRSGRAWESPVGFLVHDKAGLMVSYRGALALNHGSTCRTTPLLRPAPIARRPCLTACPVGALSGPKATTRPLPQPISTPDPGRRAFNHGCAVRRACPFSESYGRLPQQSAYHMRQFHP
jgi:epoxyqueuosine reductase